MPLHTEEDFSSVTDLRSLRYSRGARKGNITKIGNDLDSITNSPLRTIDVEELRRKRDNLLRNGEIFERIQRRIEEIDSDDNLRADEATVEDQRSSIEAICLRIESHIKAVNLYLDGVCLLDDLETLNDRRDFSNSQVLATLDDLRSRERSFRRTSYQCEDYEDIKDLTLKLKRLLSILNEKAEAAAASSVSAAPSTASISSGSSEAPIQHRSKLKIDLPVFRGDPLLWDEFWCLFTGLMDRETDIADAEKTYFLIQAMKHPDAEACARKAAAHSNSYANVVEALRRRYDRPRANYLLHFKAFLRPQKGDYTRQAMEDLVDHFSQIQRGMTHCQGYTADQIMAAQLESWFGDKLKHEWSVASENLENPPTLNDIIDFLRKRIANMPDDLLKSSSSTSSKIHHSSVSPQQSKSRNCHHKGHVLRVDQQQSESCSICHDKDHAFSKCPTFKDWNQERRFKYVKSVNACSNCMSLRHSQKKCPSRYSCRDCGLRHHTLLHKPSSRGPTNGESTATRAPASSTETTTPLTRIQSFNPSSLLCTALADVSSGSYVQTARVLLDTGASVSLITNRVVTALQMKKTPFTLNITGMGGGMVSHHYVDVTLSAAHGLDDGDSIISRCHVVDSILSTIPCQNTAALRQLPCLQGKTPLADPGFGGPTRIDVLLGIGDVTKCYRDEVVQSSDRSIQVTRTVFGWTIGGQLPALSDTGIVCRVSSDSQTDVLLTRLWEREETPEQVAVDHYLDNYQRLPSGRYSVRLPRKQPTPELGESRPAALRRFLQNERSLQRKGMLTSFNEVLQEYEDMSHSERVPPEDLSKPAKETFYLPMHGVVKPSSTTTKLRIVFDASAKSTSGISLNDQLLPGPSLYPLLSTVLNRFRLPKIALTADISKMFREVVLDPVERDFHRFLRRSDMGIEDWRMKRLTFGVSSSPYLASQVLRQVAMDNRLDFPRASEVVLSSFYVDDCITGADNVESARELQQQLFLLLQTAGMLLRKWRTNSSDLLATIPEELREKGELHISAEPHESPKTLGIHWSSSADTISVSVPTLDDSTPTKRIIASAAARLYDILGWMSPTTLYLKILLQKLWQEKLGWDEPVPDNIANKWSKWKEELPVLKHHTIPRRYSSNDSPIKSMQLHGFSDASQQGYGGVIYLRILHADATVSIALVTSKTRVAPLKSLTIPKLELCGAVLTARLLVSTASDLNIPVTHLFGWTDSSVVLGWLFQTSNRWKVFVSNRVGEIQRLVPASQWRHVATVENPADVASRGLSPKDLLSNTLWWSGPPWLSLSPDRWPPPLPALQTDELPETRVVVAVTIQDTHFSLWYRYSTYTKLVNVLSWCCRFLNRCRKKGPDIPEHPLQLSHSEIEETKLQLMIASQRQFFHSTIRLVRQKKSLPKADPLQKLCPFLDKQGLLRVGGRLGQSNLPFSTKHPVILHRNCPIVKLLIRHLHISAGHAGPSTLLALLAESYYILGSRRLVKSLSRSCVICQRAYEKPLQQQMGELPLNRIQPSPPFLSVGIDMAGPFTTKRGNPRKPVFVKSYACLFVCMATRAIHIEVCSDLSSESFLAAFSRFTARRGLPSDVMSDNGRNFVGAWREMSEVQEFLQSHELHDKVIKLNTSHSVRWHFSPARAPHFGGLWEAGVRSMKLVLTKVIGCHVLTFEEFATVLTDVEAILNSRPLMPLDSLSPNGPDTLTAGHFLIGRPLKAPPVHTFEGQKVSGLKRWNLVRRLRAEIWKAWHRRYCQSLQARSKWRLQKDNIQVGDVVMLKDEALRLRTWPLALVTEVFPGKDGLNRVAKLRCQGRLYKRSVHRLVLLVPADCGDRQPCPPEDVQVADPEANEEFQEE